ncbi:alginate O-acetyltransferase complex protein AlgI [Arenibacter sp. ARW7G5Y1]|nr:alginate O-acetyltransferase complex protein AlgI [Arenibacter sp. ARW7G5Y1]
MVFSSITFLFLFLPIVLLIYYTINKRLRNFFLTISSLFFYAWGEKELVMLMIFSIAINYLGGLVIDYVSEKKSKKAKIFTLVFVLINVLILGYYKYANFFIESINQIGLTQFSTINEILLPIGISFFTFQGMSYLIDVYYQKVPAQKNLVSLALYISMFPQLIAGPIVRYIDVSKQIESERTFRADQFREGLFRFITGLFKKVIIANQMGFIANEVFSNSFNEVGTISLWIGIITYSFQIYFDFSGYSDMAIGLGKMFGFDFLENFNYPYISQSIQEFWRRWHISLSTWFRDYLYIPLGGNRHGNFRTYYNLIIVFFITGLWHGASWNFIVWGLFHGFFLIIERVGFGSVLNKLPKILRHIYTLLVVLIGWVFFRIETLTDAMLFLKGMFGYSIKGNELIYQYFNPYFIFVLILAIVFSTPITRVFSNLATRVMAKSYQKMLAYPIMLILFLLCLLELAESNYNPFIYFRF